ncbi:glycoside hydrolase family 130 protein [Curtobacterium sp. Leaf261]|uniref:glycoside hydrolase family 130 protein n=1 Tax=Curtobacterium sp. Leaf261 TaxID=1736311 RepID=UPI0006FA0C6A|nr:glycosidase [Curtobacterium sp. Leaf261]KQO60027.1 glycosidase [Curtobacterium sp. Leaf261]
MTDALAAADFPYALERVGLLMTPLADDPFEAEGVLNPGSGRGPDGELYLLPRLVATGNVSRIGIARVVVEDGVPVGVERQGIVLEPERTWEVGAQNAGVEDPRTTFLPAIGLHVMTYVAYGPLGPHTAVAVSEDLREWRRLGPVRFGYDDALDVDLGLYFNKDCVFFPEPVVGPDGIESIAVLQRPVWDLSEIRPGEGVHPPSWVEDTRPSIWISFVHLDRVREDIGALAEWRGHRVLAGPEMPFEELKIGAGPAPIRVPEGWLLLHHGVTGELVGSLAQQQNVNYAAGAMILEAERPWEVVSRTSEPLLSADTEDEQSGIVPNVVFPTAMEEIDGVQYVFYGMADSKIGVAKIVRRSA